MQYPNGNGRDQEINAYALPVLAQEALAAQSADIDHVCGATVTSDGYVQSLQSAIDKAQPVTADGRLARRPPAWVEQVMGMPVSIHLRGRGQRGRRGRGAGRGGVRRAAGRRRAVLAVPRGQRGEPDRPRRAARSSDAHPLVAEVVALCDTARALTGGSFDAWRLRRRGGLARFDPTGLVKGWAVQRAAEHLAAGLGCDVSVNAGGDIAVRPGPDPRPWRIGIEDPRDPARVLAVVPLVVGGVATSGTAAPRAAPRRPRDGPASRRRACCRSRSSARRCSGPTSWRPRPSSGAAAGLDLVEAVAGYEALVVGRDGLRTTTRPRAAAQTRTEDMSA